MHGDDVIILGPPRTGTQETPGMQTRHADPMESYASLFEWLGGAIRGTYQSGGVALITMMLRDTETQLTIALSCGHHAEALRRVIQQNSRNEAPQCLPSDGATSSDGMTHPVGGGQSGDSSGKTLP